MAILGRIVRWLVHPLTGICCSVKGMCTAFRDEHAFQYEVVLGVVHYILLFGFVNESLEFKLVLAVLWPMLLAVELLNTAIEAVTDLASPERHELAAKAKDCASAAVSILSVTLVVLWIFIGWRAWF